jgi:hypothetical protein
MFREFVRYVQDNYIGCEIRSQVWDLSHHVLVSCAGTDALANTYCKVPGKCWHRPTRLQCGIMATVVSVNSSGSKRGSMHSIFEYI